jgi:hypothetical protein
MNFFLKTKKTFWSKMASVYFGVFRSFHVLLRGVEGDILLMFPAFAASVGVAIILVFHRFLQEISHG